MAERPERHAPLTGIAAVVLWFVSLVIVEGLTNPPSENATPERALAYFNDEEVGIFVSSFLFALAPSVGAFSNETLGPSAAEALWYLDDLFFVAAQFTAIPLLVATALVALRTGALPRWLAWLSLVVAAVLLFPLGGVFALGLGVPVWTVATSVVLSRRAGP